MITPTVSPSNRQTQRFVFPFCEDLRAHPAAPSSPFGPALGLTDSEVLDKTEVLPPSRLPPLPPSRVFRSLVPVVLLSCLGASGCKDLSTELGRNVYERELEDMFGDAPAGVVGSTPETHLVTFRENSFVSEPRANRSEHESQGLVLFREAAFRIGEARANTIEGMLALKEAGASEEFLREMFPSRDDWTAMYLEALGAAGHAFRDELHAQPDRAAEHALELELAAVRAELEALLQAEERELILELETYTPEGDCQDECEGADACSGEPRQDDDCEAGAAFNAEFIATGLPVFEVPAANPPASFADTKAQGTAGKPWRVEFACAERAGQTIELTATCLDGGSPVELSARFDVTLDALGLGRTKVTLPATWRLVRLDGPGALPRFVAFTK